jgi:hypothetical protein
LAGIVGLPVQSQETVFAATSRPQSAYAASGHSSGEAIAGLLVAGRRIVREEEPRP